MDTLYLYDGTKRQADIIRNDLLKERVWRSGNEVIFESAVKKVKDNRNRANPMVSILIVFVCLLFLGMVFLIVWANLVTVQHF